MLNGARLIEIYADHVVLERSGEKIDLYLDSKGLPSSSSASAVLLLVGGHSPEVQKKQPSVVLDQIRRPVLTDFLRPNPVFREDRLQGVELFPGSRADVFARLGLIEGDVITAVNGVAVTDANEVVTQLEELSAGGSLEVTVKRGAQEMPLNLNGFALLSESFGDTTNLEIGQEPGQ